MWEKWVGEAVHPELGRALMEASLTYPGGQPLPEIWGLIA